MTTTGRNGPEHLRNGRRGMLRSSVAGRTRMEWLAWSAIGIAVATAIASVGHATMVGSVAIDDLTASADFVFRGRCLSAQAEQAYVTEARLSVTAYTFSIDEYLKGSGPGIVTFRQVGAATEGGRDLGALVGLPTYVPGNVYVLFLLPESSAGLTSPAGAGDGAFAVSGPDLRTMRGPVRLAGRMPAAWAVPPGASRDGVTSISYEDLRRIVADHVRRQQAATP